MKVLAWVLLMVTIVTGIDWLRDGGSARTFWVNLGALVIVLWIYGRQTGERNKQEVGTDPVREARRPHDFT